MNKDQFLSFKEAKKAKLDGYNEKSLFFYNQSGELNLCHPTESFHDWSKVHELEYPNDYIERDNQSSYAAYEKRIPFENRFCCTAPTRFEYDIFIKQKNH